MISAALTTGAASDLQRVEDITHAMIHQYAMGSGDAPQAALKDQALSDLTRRIRDEEQRELAVEAHRGAGVGRELMAALCEAAEKTGCTRVEWQTDDDNESSQRFYANLGVPVHAGKVFYRIGADDIARIAREG